MKNMKPVEGIVINTREYREADMMYTAYTKELGKVMLLARGVRKSHAKLRPYLELFNHLEFYIVEGRTTRIIADVYPRENYSPVFSRDPTRFVQAQCFANFLDEQLSGEESDTELWGFISGGFRMLAKEDQRYADDQGKIFYHLIFRLSSFLGIGPQLYYCVSCARRFKAADAFFFRFQEGGMLCSACKDTGDFELDENGVKLLRIFTGREWGYTRRVKLHENDFILLDTLSKQFSSSYLLHDF